MVKCSAPLCGSATYRKTPEITIHRFPKDEKMKIAWLSKMKRQNWQPTSASVLCSKHFEAHLIDNSGFRTVLAPGAIPTIFDLLQENIGQAAQDVLPDVHNVQPSTSTSTLSQQDEEDNRRKQEEIKKIEHKTLLKNKKIKALKQQNRRLKNKVSKFSDIISGLKKQLC